MKKVICIKSKEYIFEQGDNLPLKIDLNANDGQAMRDLIVGKLYEVLAEDDGFYRIVDESGEDYLYPSSYFEICEMN